MLFLVLVADFLVLVLVFVNEIVIFSFLVIFVFVFVNENHTVWLLLLIDQRIAPETTYYVLAGMLNLQGGHQPGKHGKVREFESG